MAAAHGQGRGHRMLRAYRSRLRLQSLRDAHCRQARLRRLGAQRLQDVDYQRHRRRRRDRVGADRRRHPRLRRPHGYPRLLRPRNSQEDVAARLGHGRARLRQRPTPLLRDAAWRARAQGAAGLPQRGTLRHRLRHSRGSPRLPGDGPELRDRPRAVRQADRRLPDDAAEVRRHDARARQGHAASDSPRSTQG